MLNVLPFLLNFSEIPQMYGMNIIHTNLLSLLSFFLCLGSLFIIASVNFQRYVSDIVHILPLSKTTWYNIIISVCYFSKQNCGTLLQLHHQNAHFVFITYLFHTSPTCFGVSHTILRENIHIPTQNHLLFHSYYLGYIG